VRLEIAHKILLQNPNYWARLAVATHPYVLRAYIDRDLSFRELIETQASTEDDMASRVESDDERPDASPGRQILITAIGAALLAIGSAIVSTLAVRGWSSGVAMPAVLGDDTGLYVIELDKKKQV
jgi:hypothetical protein